MAVTKGYKNWLRKNRLEKKFYLAKKHNIYVKKNHIFVLYNVDKDKRVPIVISTFYYV